MTFKTYSFAKFKRKDKETFVASARELRFLPARALRVSGFLDRPAYLADFNLAESNSDGWVFYAKKAANNGILYALIILND